MYVLMSLVLVGFYSEVRLLFCKCFVDLELLKFKALSVVGLVCQLQEKN